MLRAHYLLLAVLAVVLPLASGSQHLPKTFKRCERHGRNVDGCLQDALQKVLGVLKNGVPSLGIPKMDPLEITELRINSGQKGPVNLDLTLKNIKVHHIFENSTRVQEPNFRLDQYRGSSAVILKHLSIDAQYEAKGRILVLPLTGSGPFSMTYDDAKIVFDIQLDPTTKRDGKEYAKVKDFKIDLGSRTKKVRMDNLISSTDKALSDNLNNFINENMDIVYAEMKPAIDEALAAAFTVYTDKIFTKVPYDEIFPEKL